MKSIREIFLPDEDEYFVKCDLSQAEDRFAKMYCNSERMRKLANLPPWEYDTHTENAKMIFEKEKINKEERYLGKKTVHASWRGMGSHKMSESVSIDTQGKLFLPPQKCDELIKRYLNNNPEIQNFYFPWVENQVRNVGILKTSWGRRYDVRNLRLNDELLRACYSFYPQAENADWTNQYGLIPAHWYMQKFTQNNRSPKRNVFLTEKKKATSLQVHDEIVVSLPFEELYDFCVFIKRCLEQTRNIQGHELTVPAETKISKTFYGGIEFAQLPDKDEFEKKLKEYFK